jgi:phage minor structural protein
LIDNLLEDVRPTNLNGQGALSWILDGTQYSHNFSSFSDITTTSTAYYIRKNVVEALLSNDENSFLNRWGGEIVRDNFSIKFLQARGIDRGVLVSYGKNILGIEESLDIDGICTRLMPIGKEGLLLDEKYIDSPYINNFPHPKIKIVEFSAAEDKATLKTLAEQYMIDNKIDIPQFNYKIDFLELSKTEEYKNYAILERVYLGDTVTIKHSKLGIDLKAKVIKIVKNPILGRIEKIELGSFKPNIGTAINNSIQTIKKEIVQVTSDYQAAIDNATKLITGSKGGNVVIRQNDNGQPYEILIMDTTDVNTAENVWRWNLGGLGHSSSGINGPYDTAITQDGHIIASFITALVVSASQVKAGILTSENEVSFFNLDDGSFNLGNKLIFDGLNLSLTGDFTTYDADTGNKAIEITKRIQSFKDWDSNNECARIFSGKLIGEETTRGLSIMGRSGKYVSLGYEDGAGLFQHAIFIDTGAYGNPGYVQINKDARFYQNVQIDGTAHIYGLLTMHDDLHPSLDDVYDVGQWGMCWKGMYSFAFNQASDREKKYNINELESYYAYEVIKDLKPYLYKYIPTQIPDDATDKEKEEIGKRLELNKKEFFAGVMADEVPIEMLNHDNEKSVNLYSYTTMLMGAVQEMMKKVERLENEVRRLGGDI